MNSNKNVTAQFERLWTLTVLAGFQSDVAGNVVSTPPGINCSWPPPSTCTAIALNGASITLATTTGPTFIIRWSGDCPNTLGPTCTVVMDNDKTVHADATRNFTVTGPRSREAALVWTTQLDAAGAEGHVGVNGALSAVRTGPTAMRSARVAGVNLVEATLSRAAGAGAWRFDFSGQPGFKRGSLRAVAGKVAVLAPDAIAFALEGKAGERIVFTFESE
jgi:hypothetical protein